MTAPSLDYDRITRRIYAELAAMPAKAGEADPPHDAQLRREKAERAEAIDHILIRECYLVAEWEWHRSVRSKSAKTRGRILNWAMAKHRVTEYPAWASAWIAGGGE